MTPDPIFDVAVVGGGFAGLSAASWLARRGFRVIVLEARPGLGGRATSFIDPATGERVDNGQHLLIGGYHETFAFLRRIDSAGAVRLQPRLDVEFVDRQGRRSRLRSLSLPAPLHLLGGIGRWTALGWRDRLAVLRLAPAIAGLRGGSRAAGAAGADGAPRTVREWLVRSGQTERSIELLWEPLAVATLNESIDVASAEPFQQVLVRMFGARRQDAALGLPVRPLDEMYAAPARRFIETHDGVVRVNAPAVISADDPPVVLVRDRPVPCRAVVCAVPWFALPDTIATRHPGLAEVIAAARGTPASPIVTVNLWLSRAVMETAFLGLPGRAMQWVFDKRALLGEDASHLSLVASGATALVARSNAEIIDLALSELRDALPAARQADVRRAIAVREKRATFSVARGLPPRPSTRTAVPGLFLAGDWLDTGLPATIESAVVSGHAAAASAAEYLRP